jgi:lipopolysaccharide export system protein LptA
VSISRLCIKFIIGLSVLGMMPLYALVSDDALPINVVSDAASVDLKQGVAVYSGHVKVVQGHRQLMGNTLTIQRAANGQIYSFVAAGNPATTEDLPNQGGNLVHGQAQMIYYYPGRGMIEYIGQAHFDQGGNVFEGDLITYNLNTQVVSSPKAKGGQQAVTTIILPAYNEQKKRDSRS